MNWHRITTGAKNELAEGYSGAANELSQAYYRCQERTGRGLLQAQGMKHVV